MRYLTTASGTAESIQLALACILTFAALAAGTVGFILIADAAHERCLARHSDRSLSDLRALCGRSQ